MCLPLNSYRFDQNDCWVLKKKGKQGPSLAPQVNPDCLSAQAGGTPSAMKARRGVDRLASAV
jgi:hypothetical protein